MIGQRAVGLTKTVTVAAGSGNGAIVLPNSNGCVIYTICIDGPGGATYTWALKDADGYTLTGAAAVSGDATYAVVLPARASCTIYFTSATDGTYNVRLWTLWGS